jgi:hypothetical protein
MAKKYEIVVTFTVTEVDVNEVYENIYDGGAPADIGDAFARIIDGLLFDGENLDNYLNGEFAITSVTDTDTEAATVADIPDTE